MVITAIALVAERITERRLDIVTLQEQAKIIADKYIPLFDELTTSDLQGCIGADVLNLRFSQVEAWNLEEMILELIYESPPCANHAKGAR